MSSDVQAKWMNAEARVSAASSATRSLEPVLDRLDVVVGLALDRLDALAVGFGEPSGERAELRCRRRRERRDLGDARLGTERDQPLDLDADAVGG